MFAPQLLPNFLALPPGPRPGDLVLHGRTKKYRGRYMRVIRGRGRISVQGYERRNGSVRTIYEDAYELRAATDPHLWCQLAGRSEIEVIDAPEG